jgi:hypothetical protein
MVVSPVHAKTSIDGQVIYKTGFSNTTDVLNVCAQYNNAGLNKWEACPEAQAVDIKQKIPNPRFVVNK